MSRNLKNMISIESSTNFESLHMVCLDILWL